MGVRHPWTSAGIKEAEHVGTRGPMIHGRMEAELPSRLDDPLHIPM